MIKLLEIQDEIEAMFLKEILEEREIPFKLQSLSDRAYGTLWQHQYGCWGYLWASERYQSLILSLVQELRQPQDEIADSASDSTGVGTDY